MIKLKSLIESVIAKGSGGYFYRVHPKGKIGDVIKYGLWSYSPSDGPGAYVDVPEMERWPDQDENDPQTYRFYVATSEWKVPNDRFQIRIPKSNLDSFHLIKCHLGDYYIDTGNDSEQILEPNQYDIKIGGRWIRADMTNQIMIKHWTRAYHKPSGFHGNKFYPDDEEDV